MNGTVDSAGAFGPTWPIGPIQWPGQPGSGPASPFHPESNRPIRLTLHTESLVDLPKSEMEALEALVELAELKDIEMLETGVGKFPRILIEKQMESGFNSIRVNYPDGSVRLTAMRTTESILPPQYGDMSAVLAHEAIRNDLFVTGTAWSLRGELQRGSIRHANLMPPSMAARIVGLFLRNRMDYHVNSHLSFQGGYHFYLMRYVLRGLWRYFSACVKVDEWKGGSPAGLGSAILKRAERALEARDAIAFEYYGGTPGAIRRIEYHFDYLMLLLSGALDAQARIASLAYGMEGPKGYAGRNFRTKEFLSGLRKAGGSKVVEVAESNMGLLRVFAELRNTIHGAALDGIQVQTMKPEAFCLEVPGRLRDLFEQLKKATSHREWRLSDIGNTLMFSPYIFADSAVREGFRVINEIAEATEVESFVADGDSGGALMDGPPLGDKLFGERMGRRLVAIGW